MSESVSTIGNLKVTPILCHRHTVVPLNFRIAATARLIQSEHQRLPVN